MPLEIPVVAKSVIAQKHCATALRLDRCGSFLTAPHAGCPARPQPARDEQREQHS